ncbi:LysR family transcriptional regulator [Algihabitans albus]|uniref:LysR family transcriptional regulator n=1 Tax=Algihabitans albus TaxID=2164067 RepID=UPI000E5CB57C|nr:LysR family transcriptional regulator [Algihabitans albus]
MVDLPRLDIRHHALLLALEETSGVQTAADRLGITQSAASHRLREAERRLGVALVRRVGRRVRLTSAGAQLLVSARGAIGDLARAERDLSDRHGGGRTLVRLGQAPYSRYHWLPAFLEFLAGRHPEIEVDLAARAARDPLGSLREGAADVVMLYGRGGQTGDLTWLRLGSDPLMAVMAPGHRLADKVAVTAEDLAGERYITYSNRPEPGFEWESVLRPAGVAPQRVSVVELPEAIIDLVRAGVGISSLSRWAVSPELADGTLVARPLQPPGGGQPGVSLDWWVVFRRTDAGGAAERVALALQASSSLHGVGLDVQNFGDPAPLDPYV